jgi:hypothetical protein
MSRPASTAIWCRWSRNAPYYGPHHEGLVTFLVYPPDDLVLVVRIQWLAE